MMRPETRGPQSNNLSEPRVWARATAGGTVTPGMLLKQSGSPFTVSQAGDGESVYGVCCSSGGTGDVVQVLVQGPTVLRARSGASWAASDRVCMAATNEVDEGTSGNPWFATLISHDAAAQEAVVLLHGDALPGVARALRDESGTKYAIDTLTLDRPLVLRTGRVESARPIGTTAQRPGTPYSGQVYYDTDIDCLLTYDGAAWVYATNHKGTSFPGSPVEGQTYYRTDHDTTYTYDGTRWLSQPFAVNIDSLRGSAVSTFNPGVGVASDDANCPLFFGRTVRILSICSQLRGGTGGRVWTTRLRLDGAGSDSFACTNTITSSAATWVRAAQEAVGLSLTATNRLNILTNATGGTETYAYSATLTVAYEAT